MNCSCIRDIQTIVADGTNQFKNKIITKAKFVNVGMAINGPALDLISFSPMEIEVEGFKRPQRYDIYHSYCPFCGMKVRKEKNSEVIKIYPAPTDAQQNQ